MSERDRIAAGSASGPGVDGVTYNGLQVDPGSLDDAQFMELVTNAYWKWFERFIFVDGKGTNLSSTVTAN